MESSGITPRDGQAGEVRRVVAPPHIEIGDTLGDRFLLRKIIGYGATGTVFSALDTTVGQKVAIKLLHPDLHDKLTSERLRREVRASRPGHPNAVTVYDLHEVDEHVFLSMELVEGTSLRDLLSKRRHLDPDEVVSLGKQIAAALEHLHERGIVHRDVKPGNILITADGTAKLCDMGLARPLEHGMTMTETEMVVGTPAYMAPEQGVAAELTSASDIYALGLTMYRSLTGTVPMTAETAVATLTRRQRERAPTVRGSCPDCPRWLNRLIRRMLEPRPADRPSATQVVRALATRRVWPRPTRRILAVIVAGVLLTAAGALVGPRLLTRQTVRIDHSETSVFGLDRDDRRTWSHPLSDPPRSVETADLDGDGREEIILAGRPGTTREARQPDAVRSYVMVVSNDGEIVTRLVPEEFIDSWAFPFRLDIAPLLHILDLDGDGWNEIVVNCRHKSFYPAVLLTYWPRWDVWERLLDHPGGIQAITAANENGRPGLRFVALNNLLGMTRVFGEIDIVPPGDRFERNGRTTSLFSPPRLINQPATVGQWRAYVPFGAGEGLPATDDRIIIDGAPDITISLGSRGPSFDTFFNPIPGPNLGKDLRHERLQYANSLHWLRPGAGAITGSGVRLLLDRIRADAGPLMDEPPYEIILSVLGAKGLAATGDLDAAIELLKTTGARHYDEDLLYRLAHLQALAGDLEDSRDTLMNVIDTGVKPRSRFDAPLLLLQVATRLRNPDDVTASIQFLSARGYAKPVQQGLRRSLAARARLWWDESTETDCDVHLVDLDADGDAIACLARWRLGRIGAVEVELMRRSIEMNPDSVKLGSVALAAALISNRRAGEAVEELDRIIPVLARSARWDFIDAEILDLARAVRVVALNAAGNTDSAEAEARSFGPKLDPNLLTGILVDEVVYQPSPR
jgi:tRNA A-37 threonylcarbamoyl transferase component Bud32